MSSSMSVNLLIDNFLGTLRALPSARARGEPSPASQAPPSQGPPSHHAPTTPGPAASTHKPIDPAVAKVLALLGIDVTDFPYLEDAFVGLVKLKIEQEKTKQYQMKLDVAAKNHSILTTALQANVPPHLIPQMCAYPEPSLPTHTHTRSNSQDFGSLPLNYRFGSGSHSRAPSNVSTPILRPEITYTGPAGPGPVGAGPGGPRRPLSPAKLGAQAVANLASPTYRFPPRKVPLVPQHQRHYSMPLEPLRNKPIDLSKIDTHQYSQYVPPQLQPPIKLPVRPPLTGPSHYRSRSAVLSLKAPLGSTTMQVKPTPAQPLQRLQRLQLPPSQESMTSFQHIIQFQHWQPEESPERSDRSERSHKRHKSNADSMSVDLGRGDPRGDRDDLGGIAEEDVSMEKN